MNAIRKKIVTDENARPVAVQIDYADWLEIERALAPLYEAEARAAAPQAHRGNDLGPLAGSILWQGDLVAPIDEPWDAEQ